MMTHRQPTTIPGDPHMRHPSWWCPRCKAEWGEATNHDQADKICTACLYPLGEPTTTKPPDAFVLGQGAVTAEEAAATAGTDIPTKAEK